MSIWVTRSSPDNLGTAERLGSGGRHPLLVPVLTSVARAAQPLTVRPDAIVFSSKHSVRHHVPPVGHGSIPVYAAGEAVAQAARAAGYRKVTWSGGDDRTLCDFMRHLLPDDGTVAHLCSDRTSRFIDDRLTGYGFKVERRVVYEMRNADLSGIAAARAALGEIDGVLVHSVTAARMVRTIIASAGWCGTIWCISPASAEVFRGLGGVRVVIARRPTEASLLGLVIRDSGQRYADRAAPTRSVAANDN